MFMAGARGKSTNKFSGNPLTTCGPLRNGGAFPDHVGRAVRISIIHLSSLQDILDIRLRGRN